MRRGFFVSLYRFFDPFRSLYERIRANEERRQKSVLFGVLSILLSVACVAIVYPGIYWGVKGLIFTFTTYFGIFTWFFGIGHIFFFSLSLLGFGLPLYLWVHGVVLVVRQLLLNRRVIGWIALVVWLASLVGIAFLTMWSLDTIVNPLLQS